jgi:hypothetical protein
MPVAAPLPVFWVDDQSALHWIPVQVAQLHRELVVIPHIAIVVSGLPERPQVSAQRTGANLGHPCNVPTPRKREPAAVDLKLAFCFRATSEYDH